MAATTHYNLDKLPSGAVDWLAMFNSNVDKIEAGRTIKLVAGEDLVVRNPFYISTSDGKAYKAANTNLVRGVWQTASTGIGATGYGQVEGIMSYGSWTWTAGSYVYVSSGKALTQTAPASHVQPIAFAVNATTIYIISTALRMNDAGKYVIASAGTNQGIDLTSSGTGTITLSVPSIPSSKSLDIQVESTSRLGLSGEGVMLHSPSDFASTPVNPTGNLKFFGHNKNVADDAYITLPAISNHAYGICIVGNNEERTQFWLNSTGTVVLLNNSANVVANADTDTNVCVGTSAAEEPLLVKNRLGATRRISVMLWYD